VILAPKKKKTAKVILAGPKKKVLQSIAKAVATAGTKTRKIAKKIRMSISSLSNRMTRAHKIRKESKELPIEKIKESLKQANLIKETTKAPDDILRQMYADYLLLKNRAL
jgi:RNA-splicing ligase RtcB